MSVSLLEAINSAGFDPLNNLEDSKWLLATQSEYEDLISQVESYVEDAESNEE